jgi:sec-independent protein translocase protein TatA
MGLDNPIHIAFLLILLLLVFGAKRLPEMGKSLGAGMRGFKDSLSGEVAHEPATQPYGPAAVIANAAPQAPVLAPVAQPVPQPVGEPVTQPVDVAEPVGGTVVEPVFAPAAGSRTPAA